MAKKKSKEVPKIGQEELSVFRFVQQSEPVTVRAVADHFADSGKARTTILTVMERLRNKGVLTREKVGATYRYSTCVASSDVMNSLVGDFVKGVLGGSLSPFMAYMSQSGDISDDDVSELRKIVRDLEKQRRNKD